jgi:cytoskeletal protein RodZ
MPTAIKWILVLIIIGGIGWFAWSRGMFSAPQPQATNTPPAATAPAPTTPPPDPNGMSVATDASDPAILQDTAAVDTQLQALDSDSTNVETSLTDKPVVQAI